MSLKQVAGTIEQHVKASWSKGLQNDIPQEIVLIEQYNPPVYLINEFEARRNDLDRSVGGRKLQTVQAFVAVRHDILRKLLKEGFSRVLGNSKLAFSTDPSIIIRETSGNQNKILLCRVTLGREGTDYQFLNNKYILDNLRGVQVAFLITYAAPNEAISLQPLSNEAEFHPTQNDQEEIVFHEAVVRRYDDDGSSSVTEGLVDTSKNVYGDSGNILKSEEDRILRHFKK